MRLVAQWMTALVAVLAAGAVAVSAAAAASPAGASLAIRDGRTWRTWWREAEAPARWPHADSVMTRALRWRALAPGVEWAEARLACAAPLWRTRLVVVRLDPARVRIDVEVGLSDDARAPAWTLDDAPDDALVALNAGQFGESQPWGWVVANGRQRYAPGTGPLSSALAFDGAGTPRWIAGDSLRVPPRGVATAFQSYPTLLAGDGEVPRPLREDGLGVDRVHRDARLAIGTTREGRVLIVMTRFDALGESAGALPMGPTTPETAAIMGALGAHAAVMLDGGISAQMRLRDARGHVRGSWRGWRAVPLALIVRARSR